MVMQYYQRIAITFVDVLFIQQEFVPREIVEVEREGPRTYLRQASISRLAPKNNKTKTFPSPCFVLGSR